MSKKITDFENPLTGKKGSLLDFVGLWQMVLGVFVLFFVVATGQNVAKKVGGTTKWIDTSVENPVSSPAVKSSKVII